MPNLLDNPTITNVLIGGLALLAATIVVIVVFRQINRRARTRASVPPPPISVPPEPAQATTPPPQPVEITLEFMTDTGQAVIFKLDKPALTVGRGPDNDIVIPAAVPNMVTVSQCHARLGRNQDEYVVRDLGSKNGLTVNGRQTLENLLQNGDQIGFGTAIAVFHQPLAGGTAAYRGGPKPGGTA
jgi:pSer/pThr/pTyr-binding forkhead associated (FHA) protein